MPKPIFTIGFPIKAMREDVQRVQEDLEKKLGEDYHVLIYRAQELEGLKFEVLNAINATDVEISELIELTKKQIEETIKNNT